MKQLLDYVLYVFLLSIRALLRRVSRERAMKISSAISRALYHLVRGPRKTIEQNLKFIYNGSMTDKEVNNLTRKIFNFQVKNQVGLMIYRNPAESRLLSIMSIKNQNLIDDGLKQGKGILLLSAHFGDMSLGITRLAAEGYPVYVITRVLSNPYLFAYLNKTYAERNVTMIRRGEDSKNTYYKLLSENKILATAVDQHAQEKGITISFLGKPAQAPCGWVVLAKKSGARVLVCLCVSDDDEHHHFAVEDPQVTFTDNPERDLYENTVKVNAVIEKYIYKYPEQWFWMHKRWRTLS